MRPKEKLHSGLRRVSVMILALLLSLAVLPVRADALTGSTGALTWSLSGGTLRITGSGPMPDYSDANMPPWYDSADAINRIRVGEGVTSVGSIAFYGCEAVQSVTLPSSITRIGARAFKNCRAMTWLNLPEGLVSIGEAAFESCEALRGILLPQSLRSIGDYAFDRCEGLTAITIPAGVEELGRIVFYYCAGLTQATIRCPIEKVPDGFFYGCTALTAVTLPVTVTAVGSRSFENCTNLRTVYCAEAAIDSVSAALREEETTGSVQVEPSREVAPPVNSVTVDKKNSATQVISVTETEQAQITTTTKTQYTYTVNGEDATLEDALRAGEGSTVTADKVSSSTTVSATVSGSSGWQEVGSAAKDAVSRAESGETGGVQVDVQLNGSTVKGEDITELVADPDTKLTISTGDGCTWVIDRTEQTAERLEKAEYDLAFDVELLDKSPAKIESDTVYQLDFPSSVELKATVGVPLKMSDAYHYATLYEKDGAPLATVQVDGDAKAWFPVDGVSQRTTYYIAIDAAGVDRNEAIIPDPLLGNYGVEYAETLTDASGKQYIVGERTSRWGITGGQFALYTAIVIAAVVLIVAGVMFTLNKIGRTKAKYAAMAAEDAAARAEIDEEELRLQVMQELLEETKQKNEENKRG